MPHITEERHHIPQDRGSTGKRSRTGVAFVVIDKVGNSRGKHPVEEKTAEGRGALGKGRAPIKAEDPVAYMKGVVGFRSQRDGKMPRWQVPQEGTADSRSQRRHLLSRQGKTNG